MNYIENKHITPEILLEALLNQANEDEFVEYFELGFDEHRCCFYPDDIAILKVIYRKLKEREKYEQTKINL